MSKLNPITFAFAALFLIMTGLLLVNPKPGETKPRKISFMTPDIILAPEKGPLRLSTMSIDPLPDHPWFRSVAIYWKAPSPTTPKSSAGASSPPVIG